MLLRTRIAIMTVGVALSLGVGASAAQAQDYPGTVPPPAPAVCTSVVTAGGALLPGATTTISGTCALLAGAGLVDGILNSHPIDLPVVNVSGTTATFPVTLPNDWETNAFHTLSITDAETGTLLFNGRFFVDKNGRITAAPAKGAIPRTGSSATEDFTKGGIALLGVGAAVTFAARRRRLAAASAA